MMWGVDSGMGWWMLFSSTLFILFWVGVVALVVWVARGFGSQATGDRKPLDIAKERYARGEITREELEQITEGLQKAA